MWHGCVSLAGPGRFHSSAVSAFLLLHPVLWSQADGIPGADRPPGWHFLSSAVLPQPELTSSTQEAVVPVLQFTGTHCAPGPPAADEAMGSLTIGDVLVWT